MGWSATDDPFSQIRLKFPALTAAVDYAERKGLDYEVIDPPARYGRSRLAKSEQVVAMAYVTRSLMSLPVKTRMNQSEPNGGATMNLGDLIPWRDKSQVSTPRDDFFDPIVSLRREMDRMFDDFFNGSSGRGLRPLAGGWSGVTPTIDVEEHEKEVVVTAELPGLDDKDFELTLMGDILTIKGEKKAEHEHKNGEAYYTERRYGAFSRAVRLPFEVKDENIDAKYDKGVLTVRIPKPADVQKAVRRIEVKAA
jgi:HSP20 family protein